MAARESALHAEMSASASDATRLNELQGALDDVGRARIVAEDEWLEASQDAEQA